MTLRQRLTPRAWVLVPVCSLGLLVWINQARIKRIEYVTGQASWSVDAPAVDQASPTGYAGGVRQLLVPERNSESQQWLMQTQQMLNRGEWRVRHVDYDNAPWGRETHLPSLYHWWLGLLAWLDHVLSGGSAALGVEHAALYADPLLQVLLLIGTTLFTARWFGALPASMFSVGLVALFPLGGQFLPGVPDHRSLVNICVLWSVLPLLAGLRGFGLPVRSPADGRPTDGRVVGQAPRWFFAAGVVGGLGIWINPTGQLPILAGIGVGALLAAWLARGDRADEFNSGQVGLWRIWALGGGATVLAASLIEYYPASTDLRLETIHPLYGLGWIGAGELLAQMVAWIQGGKISLSFRKLTGPLLAAALIFFIVRLAINSHALSADPFASRLTNLPHGAEAPNLAAWIKQDGASPVVLATLLPLLLAVPALILLLRRKTAGVLRASIALALGPVLVALGMACFQLRWWNLFDSALLVLLVGATGAHCVISARGARWLWPSLLALLIVPGLARLLPPRETGQSAELSETEVRSLIDRDLAQWLTKRAAGTNAVVLASPDLTAALCFYGQLRGLGTLSPENLDGVTAAVRIASATFAEEAWALINQRNITYIIIPSWDVSLDQYAQMGSNLPDRVFIRSLHNWNLPPWLRPITYYLPKIPGYEGQGVVVLEVVEEQDDALALSHLAEYFVETGQVDLAGSVGEKLKRYPADLGALSALAQVELARGNHEAFASLLNKLIAYSARGADRTMAWDRRLSLAVVLAQGKRLDLARELIRRCLAEADEARLRSLTTNALLRLLTLKKLSGHEFPDPHLQELALGLLPPTLRQRL